VTGLPSGVTAVFTPATIGAPGSGSSSLKLTAGSSVKAGNYTATVSATSGSTKKQVLIGVSIS
jgi:hypothetical protein